MASKKIIRSWALYDWANSVYSTTVMAGFFPIFFKQYWSAGADAVVTTAKLGTTLSVSGLLIAVMSPTLGALADRRGLKKKLLGLFMLVGAGTCVWLAFIPQGDWASAMVAYGLGMFAFAASVVFYDALLPSLARGTEMDHVSSFGYSLGYLGGAVLFTVNVIMTIKPQWFGLADAAAAVKASFLSVAVWWAVFSIPLFKNVPEPASAPNLTDENGAPLGVFAHFRQTIVDLMKHRQLAIFLLAYWLYIDGVYTVMVMAVDFGLSIGLKSNDLIGALLLVQFLGFPATYLFGRITGRLGCRAPILFAIGLYSAAVVLSYWMTEGWQFYALAVLIGLVQGGVQSLSRSLFGHMVPARREGEFFGLFNLIGKFASILGPFFVGMMVMITREPRLGMTGLVVLFALGAWLLLKVREPRFAPGGERRH